MSHQSKSESLFETFCDLNQISCERIEESSRVKTPDYKINLSGQDIIVEIKQFDPSKEEKDVINRKQQGENIAFDINPGERIRKAIRKANPQLKMFSERKIPTLLVVFDNVTPYQFHTEDYCVMTAMKGVDQIPVLVPKDIQKSAIFGEVESGGNRAMRPDANTAISAVATMRLYADDNILFCIYHNRFAAVPMDKALFRVGKVKQFELPEGSKNSLDQWVIL